MGQIKMKTKVAILISILFVLSLIAGCSRESVSVPAIKSIEFLDKDNNPLPVTDGWVKLQAVNEIKVTYEGDATYVDFFTVPTGTGVTLEQKIIGRVYVKKGDNTATLEWEPPDGFLGNVWALVYNGDVARTSDTNKFFIKAIYE